MILADFNDGAYKTVLLFHIIAVVISLAPAVMHPILFSLEKTRDDGDLVGLAKRVVGVPTRIYTIALIAAGVLGIGLISMGDPVTSFGDTWIWLSLLVWIAVNGVLHAGVFPAERAIADGDTGAMAKFDRFGRIVVFLMLVLLYLMVIKPGADGI